MNSLQAGPAIFPLPPLTTPRTPAPHPHHRRSRRVVLRHQFNRESTIMGNQIIASLNHLYSYRFRLPAHPYSRPHSFTTVVRNDTSSPPLPTANRAITQRLLSYVHTSTARFRRELRRHSCEHADLVTAASFPSALKREHTHALNASEDIYQQTTTAIPILAAKVSLPTEAGTADLLSILPQDLATLYSNNDKLLRPSEELSKLPEVRPVCYANHTEYRLLVQRMLRSGMLDFTTQPRCVNGVFGVPKDDGKAIRLIIDARPANRIFNDPPSVTLPTPEHIARITCPPLRDFFVMKSDLDNCYHSIRAPKWLQPYFALPPLRASEIGSDIAARYGADTQVWPMCTTLPMGWSHSVFVAQSAHERILTEFTDLQPADRIGPNLNDTALRPGRVLHAVYIDDVSFFGYDPAHIQQLFQQYEAAVGRFGLRIKLSKVVGPTTAPTEVLGVEIDGCEHTVGVSPSKLHRLIADTWHLINTGQCTGLTLSRIVGRWTWAALVNRAALSVFNAVYRMIEAAWGRRFTIWGSVQTELRVMAGLAPLLYADLSLPEFPYVVATDASSEGFGVVATVLKHGAAISLVDQISGEDDSVFIKNLHWHTIMSKPWVNKNEHINVLELRTVILALKWVLSFRRSLATRLLLVGDSTAVIGAVRKGRTSAFGLLIRLRTLAALSLASGVRLVMEWCPSELNPADHPSRNFY